MIPYRTFLLAFVTTLATMGAVAAKENGVCTPEEEAKWLCFESPSGFVVEAVRGHDGEFPVLDHHGNSRFSYRITGPGAKCGSCAGVRDVSHASILLPACESVVLVCAWPKDELLPMGHGDKSCDFGKGDTGHRVLKWDCEVRCKESAVFTLVVRGDVGAEPTDFLLKAGKQCYVGKILGPACERVGTYCFGATGCPCGNDDPSGEGGCGNASGSGARLRASGSASVASDDLVLTTDRLPAGSTAWLIMGGTAPSTLFEDGFLCVGPRQHAFLFPAQLVGPSGVVDEGPGIAAFTCSSPKNRRRCILPGSTRYFQTFYRDPNGMLGRCWGKNFSNALSVTFR